MKFELYQNRKNEQWYFRLKMDNGEYLFYSVGYGSKEECEQGVDWVTINHTEKHKYSTQISSNGRHYFTLQTNEKEQIGQSEYFHNKKVCELALKALLNMETSPQVVFIE